MAFGSLRNKEECSKSNQLAYFVDSVFISYSTLSMISNETKFAHTEFGQESYGLGKGRKITEEEPKL